MSFIRYGLFKVVLAVYKFLNDLTTIAIGYSLFSGHKRDRGLMFEDYDRSAHVMRVIFKRRKFELEGPKIKHFLLRYDQTIFYTSVGFQVKLHSYDWSKKIKRSIQFLDMINTPIRILHWALT